MDILAELINIAKEAGHELLKHYDQNVSVSYKEDNSPVTAADLAAQELIVKRLAAFGYPIISEESRQHDPKRFGAKRFFLVDPLDGTKDFLEKNGEFSVMIGLVEGTRPIIGVVHQPTVGIVYYAEKGKGAYQQTGSEKPARMHVSQTRDVTKANMLISRHHLRKKELEIAKNLGITNLQSAGSAGLKAGLIASGQAELFLITGGNSGEWDSCAADIIISEAGGMITDMNGDTLIYNKPILKNPRGIVVSNGAIHSLVIQAASVT